MRSIVLYKIPIIPCFLLYLPSGRYIDMMDSWTVSKYNIFLKYSYNMSERLLLEWLKI